MKKRSILCALSIILSLLCFTSCVLPTSMYENGMEDHDFDYEAIGELVQNYITNKYGIDCEMCEAISYSFGGDKYVRAWFKTSNDENEYMVEIYPETDEDSDGDGYYDSYYITADLYFQTYIQPMVIPWIHDLAEQYVNFDKYLVFASLGYEGLLKDSKAPKNVDEIINKGNKAGLELYVIIPEDEYSDDASTLEKINGLTEYLKKTNMDCSGQIMIYSHEIYEKVSQCVTVTDYAYNIRKYNEINYIYLFKD